MTRQVIIKDNDVLSKALFDDLENIFGTEKVDYSYFKPILKQYLQTAVLIEHSTIPPYLTAMYSIEEGTNLLVNQILRSVVVEEMLHMIMVCNVMNALDLKPTVNREENYPTYPTKLPLNVNFFVNLEKFSVNSISSFIAIEQPDSLLVKAPDVALRAGLMHEQKALSAVSTADKITQMTEILQKYVAELNTIGEFYSFLLKLIQYVQAQTIDDIFVQDTHLQITPEHYYGSGGQLVVVKHIDDVKVVFQEIMDQGEGALLDQDGQSSMYDKDISQFSEGYELAHYYRFKEILHEHFYIGGDYSSFIVDDHNNIPITTPPNGKTLAVDWSAVYPMKTNAKLTDYVADPILLEQAKEFNKTYKRLLDAIQAAIEGRQQELEKSIMYMYALKAQAIGLMKQPLTAQENAAPTFEYINL